MAAKVATIVGDVTSLQQRHHPEHNLVKKLVLVKILEFLRLDFSRPNCFHFANDPLRLLLFLWILLSRVICDRVRSNTSIPCVLFGSNWWKQITVPVTVNIWCCNNISVLRSIYFGCKYSAITSINLIKIKLLKRIWTFSMAIKKATGPAFGKRLRCNHLLSDLCFIPFEFVSTFL